MKSDSAMTEIQWEKLRGSGFSTENFVKSMELFDSIRHIAGTSSFASEIYDDVQKIKELSVNVFVDGRKNCVEEMFFKGESLGSVMNDLEDWISNMRKAFARLNELKP
jgi:hypothetical protein